MRRPMKNLAFTALTILILAAVFTQLVALALPRLKRALNDQLVQAVVLTLTGEEREAVYREVADAAGGIWDVVPDPRVARLAKRNLTVTYARAEVRTNSAGLRSSKPFTEKAPGQFRIICLGDSMVFGQGGLEADRFCDQIEAFYRAKGIMVDGRTIETYAVGLGGWTTVQEANYLGSRLSAYDPDVVLVLTVGNDITDNLGVTGAGTTTMAFSPEHRDRGSATFSDIAGRMFGMGRQTALSTEIGPEARARWRKAMQTLRRLSEVQTRRGGKILSSVSLRTNPKSSYFVETYKRFYLEHGPATPFVVTSYFRGEETMLPHNAHPNRRGHAIFAGHYIHMLDRLGWIAVPEGELPPLDPRLSLETDLAPDLELLRHHRLRFIRANLRSSLDFTRLDRRHTMAFLGGILPDEIGPSALDAPPWASVRSGFLLRRENPEEAADAIVEIRIPPHPELYPLRVDMLLDGRLAGSFVYAEPAETGHHVLEAPLTTPGEEAVEIVLETDAYFCGIDDHRMKSFQLISAEVRER